MGELVARFVIEVIQPGRARPECAPQARPRRDAVDVPGMHADRVRTAAERHTRPVFARPARASDRLYKETATAAIVTHDVRILYKYTVYRAIRWCRQLEQLGTADVYQLPCAA